MKAIIALFFGLAATKLLLYAAGSDWWEYLP